MRLVLIASTLLFASSAALAAPPAKYLDDEARGDSSEAMLGKLISTRGHNAKTRAFGDMLVTDHTAHRDKVDALAAQKSTKPSHTPMPVAQNERAKLQRLHGVAFDREVRRYMIQDHLKDIDTNAKQARGSDADTAQLARDTLPTLRHHLAMARAL